MTFIFKEFLAVKKLKPKFILLGKGLLSFFIAFLGFLSCAQAGGPGTTGAVELKIPVSPRAIAMGQAFVAVANDANAIYWNPAGLNQLGGAHITAQYDVFIETVRYDYFAGATKLGNDAALGIAAKLLSTGTDPAYDSTGAPTGGSVGENYMDIDLAGAYRLSYYFDVGLTVKYISKTLSGTSASTFAADLGVLYHTPIPHLTAGLNIQNIGPGLKFDQVADPLPFNIKLGVAYKMFDDNFTIAYDTNFPNDNAISASVGGEYWYKDTLVGRFGYQFQGTIDQNQYGIGGTAGLYLGAGVKIAAFKDFIGLDYAWTNTGFLGSNHHFALDFYF
jgi:long-subunit fatty acid transport protein